jgi:D-glycero-alpha-D-manno-heptose-7-phosphate kinase
MISHVRDLKITSDQLLLDAIKLIENSRIQIAFVVDHDDVLVGLLTNGDVRRFLLNGGQASSSIAECMNRNFRSISQDADREALLKLFDLGFNAVPMVDAAGKLIDYATPDLLPTTKEGPILVRSRAPVRVGFSGGGTDVTYYFVENKGVVLNTSIALYAHATLIPSRGPEIGIYSNDIDMVEHYQSLRELLDNPDKGLVSSVVSVIRPTYGFDLYVHSDFPVGSGLGGSSAVAVSVVATFNEMRHDRWSTYDIAELAFHAERLCFGVAGGWQDHYASAFGGFNLIELDGVRNVVNPIRLAPEASNELEECLILCHTGISHRSGPMHEQQREAVNSAVGKKYLNGLGDLCDRMHKHLLRQHLDDFGRCLHEAWELKKQLSTSISGGWIDELYTAAIAAGALGGKLLGAGGGGFFLFYVPTRQRMAVSRVLIDKGCRIYPFRLDREGVTSWKRKLV